MATLTGSSASLWSNGDVDDQPTTHLAFSASSSDIVLIATSEGDANTIRAEIEGWQSPEDTYAAMAGSASAWVPRGSWRTPFTPCGR